MRTIRWCALGISKKERIMIDGVKGDQRNASTKGDAGGYEFDAEKNEEQKISHESFAQNQRDKKALAIALIVLTAIIVLPRLL